MSHLLKAKDTNPREGGASFSLSHRLLRLIWSIVWGVLASWTPPPLHGWRRFLLSCFGAKIHKTARVYGSVHIWYPPNLRMGAHAVLGPGVVCYCMDCINIEDYAIISQRAHLCGGTHEPDDPNFQLIPKPVNVKSKAWVAAEAFIGPGVTIHEGALIGARAAVFKNVPAWEVWVGNPAIKIRNRRKF